MVWEALDQVVQKNDVILVVVMKTGSPSEAWRTLVKMAAETYKAAGNRAKKELEGFQISSNEKAGEYFARASMILSKLQKYDVTISQRKIRQHVLSGLSPRFPADVYSFVRRESFALSIA